MFTDKQKQLLKRQLVESLRTESEIRRIVIFGSFLTSDDPHDLDIAVFQDSDDKYLPLAMKYRRRTREISRIIPIDIIPLRAGVKEGFLWKRLIAERLSMKEQTRKWLEYADDNLLSARLLLENKLFNPCLQNIQQSVENRSLVPDVCPFANFRI
jgi:predicted nucleotidyltransferase